MSLLDEVYKYLEALGSGEPIRGEVIGTDKINDYIIDTCNTADCGYETGIKKITGTNEWIIVQRYKDAELAKKGHSIWCSMCAGNPTKAYSVQLNEYVNF